MHEGKNVPSGSTAVSDEHIDSEQYVASRASTILSCKKQSFTNAVRVYICALCVHSIVTIVAVSTNRVTFRGYHFDCNQ